MTTAVIYSRVSTSEQGDRGFSLPDQKERLTAYCNRLNIHILQHFQDDFTGTHFDRPGFNSLLKFLKASRADYVFFTKWSRFSRNTTDSFDMIRKLKGMGVRVQAIDEQIDFEIPQNHLTLAVQLALPQVDNEMRYDTTRRGTIRALSQGRYLGSAPTGYKNARDAERKPIIIPDEKAPHIVRAFELMATGANSQRDVVKLLRKEDINFSKSRLAEILRNQVYAGNILVPAYKSEPSRIVKGIHTPIVSESLFYQVQDILNGKKRDKFKKKSTFNPTFPLKGFIYCVQDHKLTGSCSHGHGGIYPYYHCQNEHKCGRFHADVVNDEFLNELSRVRINEYTVSHVTKTLRYLIEPNPVNSMAIQNQIREKERDIQQLIDDRVKRIITPEDYNHTRARYEMELAKLKSDLDNIATAGRDLNQNIEICTHYTRNLPELYEKTPPESKKHLLGSILSGNLVFDGKSYRTIKWNPFIELLTNSSKGFEASQIFEKNQYGTLPCRVAGAGQIIEPLRLIACIKSLSETYKMLVA